MVDWLKWSRYLFVEFLGSLILGIGQNYFRRQYISKNNTELTVTLMIGLYVFPFWAFGWMAMCYRITGAHLNPIITFVQLLRRDKKQGFEYVLAFLYIFAQYLGHWWGVALSWWYTTTPFSLNIANNGTIWLYADAVGQEFVASFMFVLIYLHQTSEVSMLSKETALQLLVIAGTYASCVAWSFYKAGGSINPAFGFASNFWDQMKFAGANPFKFIWLYTVIPLVGAAAAYALNHLVVPPGKRDSKNQEKVAQH